MSAPDLQVVAGFGVRVSRNVLEMGQVRREGRLFWFTGPCYEAIAMFEASNRGDSLARDFIDAWRLYRFEDTNRDKLTLAQAAYVKWDRARIVVTLKGLLITPARNANIALPDQWQSIANGEFAPELFPHLHVFLTFQIGRVVVGGTSHWSNAIAIAKVPADRIRSVTAEELISEFGCQ